MNAQKLTQKSIEAVQSAQDIAIEYQNNAIEPEHLMYSLLNQENGLIPQLMTKNEYRKSVNQQFSTVSDFSDA